MTKYSWVDIKADYVEGAINEEGNFIYPTFDDLVEKHGCSYSSLSKKAANERWMQERKIFETKMQERRQEMKAEAIASESASFDSKCLTAADEILAVVKERAKQPDLRSSEYDVLSRAIVNLQKVGKLALGEVTEHVKKEDDSLANLVKIIDKK